jgi:predicted phosphohydrolase
MNQKWINKYSLAVKADVLLLAGDIMPLSQMDRHTDFLDFVSAHFKATYWIPGNHEYYHSDISNTGTLNKAIRENVFLVNNTCITLGDTDLICSTLWSHISPGDELQVTRAMSDFHLIKNGNALLSVADYNLLHQSARQFIEQAVQNSTAKHKIILTHHVPTLMNYPPKYKGDVLTQAFATEMHDLILSSGADCWIYGHSHNNTPDFTIGHTQLLTNQLGYVKYGENKHFDNGKMFTIV